MSEERWADVRGHEGAYQVSNLGGLRSRYRRGGRGIGFVLGTEWRLCQPARNPDSGYLQVTLYKNGTSITRRFHKVIHEAFHGPVPEGLVVRHLDDDVANNRLDNLDLGTNQDNSNDAARNGRTKRGTQLPGAKLDDEKVRWIKRRLLAGDRQKDIARDAKVNRALIYLIGKGKKWKHVLVA